MQTQATPCNWPDNTNAINHGTFVVSRWFDGSNTYHKVRAYAATGETFESDVAYGYGNAWEVTARKLMSLPPVEAGKGNLDAFGWHVHVQDVTRKRDL